MDTDALRGFLVRSNDAGYAGGDEKAWTKGADGSWTIVYEEGRWRSDDNFFGGEPYGGRTVVFHDEAPVWMLVYYGWVHDNSDPKRLYGVLKNALKGMPFEAPFRGPRCYQEGDCTYANDWNGDVDRFTGRETIRQGTSIAYQADYAGGLVDVRREV